MLYLHVVGTCCRYMLYVNVVHYITIHILLVRSDGVKHPYIYCMCVCVCGAVGGRVWVGCLCCWVGVSGVEVLLCVCACVGGVNMLMGGCGSGFGCGCSDSRYMHNMIFYCLLHKYAHDILHCSNLKQWTNTYCMYWYMNNNSYSICVCVYMY